MVDQEKYDFLKEKYDKLQRRSGLMFKNIGLVAPATDIVVDVGAGSGTPNLYKAFPKSKFYLIDALEKNRERLMAFTASYNAAVIISGVGSKRSQLAIDVAGNEHGSRSSFLKRSGKFEKEGRASEVINVERLDHLIQPSDRSIGLKLDVEGFELEVLKGALGLFPQVSWILAELSIARRFADDPMFDGVNQFLRVHDFVWRDIVDLRRNAKGDLRFIDALFVKKSYVDFPRKNFLDPAQNGQKESH